MDKIEELIKKLKDENWRVRWNAALALREIGDERAIEPLINALRDGYSDVRNAAFKALEEIEPEWHKTEVVGRQVPEFINALRDKDSDVRSAAAWVLGKIRDKRSVAPLINALRDWDQRVRSAAFKALEEIEPEWHKTEVAKRQVPEFINALRDKDLDVRNAAFKVLEEIEPEWHKTEVAKRQVPEFINALRDRDSDVRSAAAWVLGKIGDERSVESLINALMDEYWHVREAACKALGKIKDQKAIKFLINTLRDGYSYVRNAAFKALEEIEPEWHKTEVVGRQVPEFVKTLKKAKDKEYRNYLKLLVEKIFFSHKPFVDSYPYLFCTNCMLRTKKEKVRVKFFKKWSYVVCRGCGTAEALIIGIKKVVGIIGGNISDYSIDGDTAYVRLWFEKEKSARNADIDMLLITESEDIKDENEYDKAINTVYDVLVNDRSRSRKYIKKIPVLIQGNLPLSIRAKRVLENEFGGMTHL